jgi:hypothetical protein
MARDILHEKPETESVMNLDGATATCTLAFVQSGPGSDVQAPQSGDVVCSLPMYSELKMPWGLSVPAAAPNKVTHNRPTSRRPSANGAVATGVVLGAKERTWRRSG